MSTQKAKFELFRRLTELGFSYDEAAQLRRIEMTLQRWAEGECGSGNDYCSWHIERDPVSEKPFRVVIPNQGQTRRYPIADREAGALRRLRAMMAKHPGLSFYHQTDPRGCALYIIRPGDVRADEDVSAVYNRGLAVCA